MAPAPPPLPPKFLAKKQSILSQLATDPADYDDKSPKGSVDVEILELIGLINGVEGWLTTSSCGGRAAVFVEGPKREFPADLKEAPVASSLNDELQETIKGVVTTNGAEQTSSSIEDIAPTKTTPSGKGGGHWLYVSHEPFKQPQPTAQYESKWTPYLGLHPYSGPRLVEPVFRMVHLTYSPLILHVLCATLHHARPLLAAAINAGFRESGVQSLKALDSDFNGDGVMVAIRTNGLVFDSIIGCFDPNSREAEAIVDESYLETSVAIINERFRWNEVRKERLVRELYSAIEREGWQSANQGETKDERRERKRREGLEAQRQKQKQEALAANVSRFADDISDDAGTNEADIELLLASG